MLPSLSVALAIILTGQSGAGGPAQTWLDKACQQVTPFEAKLLTRAQTTLLGNLVTGKAWSPYLGVMPSLGTYRGVWNWDSAFHAVALSLWDPKLARDQFRILFDKQLPTGALPDVIFEDGRIVTDFTKPPVMAWAIAVVDHRSPDTDFLREIYPKVVHLGEFFEKHRGGEMDGLFFYAGAHTGMDSGWDDSMRWDGGYQTSQTDEKRLWAVDLNCYMVSHYQALAYMAGRLGKTKEVTQWHAKADTLAAKINRELWDDRIGAYVDRDRVTKRNGPALSPVAFMPLFVHIAPKDRAKRLADLATNPDKFYPGMPTVAYDTKGFDPRGYWRGPAWLNTTFFALKGLRDYGFADLADDMRANLLGWVNKNPDSIYEYYDSRVGDGLGAKGFGWSSAFLLCFMCDWKNDNLTWLFAPAAPN